MFVVIAVTLISSLSAGLYYYPQIFDSYSYYNTNDKIIFQSITSCKKLYPDNINDRNNCETQLLKPLEDADSYGQMSLKVAVFLPLLFFGGGRLLRYLFPTIDKDKKSDTLRST